MLRIGLAMLVAAALALTGLAPQARAGKKDDTLRYSSDLDVENVDAYYNNVREGIVLARLIWDQLIWRNPVTGEYKGMLAKSWKWTDSTTIDVELRQGIKFHNGQPFDADDVVYTLNYVVDPVSKVVTANNVNWIKNAEKRGPFSVRIHLKEPFPSALEYLAGPVVIYPHVYYKQAGPKGMGEKPIGTGPYRVTEVQPGKLVRLEKNPDYFKDSPQGQPSIGKIEFRPIPEQNTQFAELMAGGIDWIWRVPVDQMDNLARQPGVAVKLGETMRVGSLMFAASGKIPDAPTNKQKVREAIAYAINRDAIRVNLAGSVARLVHTPCFPEQFGCIEKGVRTFEYDPAKAKKLLAEAGYPNGFSTDIYSYGARDRPYVEAIVGDLRQVGIIANLKSLQYAAWRDEVRAGHAQLFFGSWGSFSIADISAFTGYYFRFGPDDTTRDPEVRDWLQTGDTSIDPDVRRANYTKALKRIAERMYWLPFFTYPTGYAFTSDLDFTPNVDEVPRFVNSRWK